MAKKIVDETLKFTVVIAGNQAQKEYGQLSRAQKKLIEETKDLETQAEKLRKANKQNSEEYKKLTQTIDANNKTVKEQETRMGQLSNEIGINNLTTRQLAKEANKLRGILSNLTPGTDDWKKYTQQLQSVTARQANLREEMRATEMTLEDQEKALGQLTIGFGQLFTGIKSGNYADVSDGLRTITGGLKTATKAAWAFIATPIGAAIAALAGIGFVVKQWFDYNDAIKESIILTEQITKQTGAQADAIRLRNQAISETFGTDQQETLIVARNLVENFGITYEEALATIEDGLVRGQGKNTEYLDSLREYPTFFAQAGYSVQEFKDIVAAGFDLGIYSDKLPDAIKEFDISIREQTKATREALINAFGQTFTDDLLARVNSGKTTTKEALQEIASESDRLGLNLEQNARLTADVFRGAGEDAGGAIKVFQAVNSAAQSANTSLTPLEKSTRELADANLELAKAQDEALKSDNYISFTREVQIIWTKIKTFFFEGIKFITDSFTKGTDFVITTILSLAVTAKQLPSILIQGLKDIRNNVVNVIKTFGGLSEVFKNLASFKFEAAAESAKNFKDNFTNAFNEVKTSATDVVKDIINVQQTAQKLAQQQLNDKRAGNVASVNAENASVNINPNNGNNFEESEAAKSAREKAIADALRKKQAVQDAIDKFDEEQAIRDQLKQVEKDQRAEEEAVIRKEIEFQKLTEEAQGDTELLAQLETAKLNEIQAIRDSFAEQRLAKEEAEKKKLVDIQQKAAEEQAQAVIRLEEAKKNAREFGLNALRNILGKETALGKFIFLFQKAKAVQEIIQTTALANAKIASGLAAANALALTYGPIIAPGLIATNTTTAAANKAANNINAAVQIGTIASTAIQGFEKGLYPVTRAQDGKRYQAGINTSQTQIANNPTILVGERPEMVIDPNTFRKMDPQIIDYILQLAGKRPLPGYETGSYPKQDSAAPSGNSNQDAVMGMLANAVNRLVENGVKAYLNYGINEELGRQEIEDKLKATKNASKN